MKTFTKILKYGAFLSTIGFIGSTLIQIYARFFMESAPPWTEEAARVFFIHAVSFSAGLAVRGNYYVNFDLVYQYLPQKVQRTLDIVSRILICVLFFICAYYGLEFAMNGFDEKSPSMGISMAIPFVSTVIMGSAIFLFTLVELIKKLRQAK
ncbi:TRAP-type C4-dicarboxylate transport system permease small subunit [Flavobacteriaceae bacterium MAR_2009_75]|nr:TRAP-type C4-dicarboxylate transport system permease small subunit [Flavobacteriaceae bacterium MAR_2009_75]